MVRRFEQLVVGFGSLVGVYLHYVVYEAVLDLQKLSYLDSEAMLQGATLCKRPSSNKLSKLNHVAKVYFSLKISI